MNRLLTRFRPKPPAPPDLQAAAQFGDQLRFNLPFLMPEMYDSVMANAGTPSAFDIGDEALAQAYATGVTAWACTNVRARILSQVPIGIFVDDSEAPATKETGVLGFVANSRRYMSQIETSLCIWGKAYLIKCFSPQGYPTEVKWISNLFVDDVLDSRGLAVAYRDRYHNTLWTPDEMIVITNFNPTHPSDGIAPLEVAYQSISIDGSISTFATAYFRNGAKISGILTSEGMVSPDDKEFIQKQMEQFRGVKNAFKALILPHTAGGKWNWNPVSVAPVDLAMVELKNMASGAVCTAFETPPTLIGLGSVSDQLGASNTYQQVWNQFILNFAIPRMEWIVDELNRQWLVELDGLIAGKVRLRVKPEQLYSITNATNERATFVSTALSSGAMQLSQAQAFLGQPVETDIIQRAPAWASQMWLDNVITRNEYRKYCGLPPVDDGDKYKSEYDALNTPQYPSFPSLNNPIPKYPQLESGLVDNTPSEPVESILENYELPNGARARKVLLADGTIVQRRSDQSVIFAALAKWKDKAKKRGRGQAFENETIPSEVVEFIRTALDNTYFDISEIFLIARHYVQNGAWLPLGASEDETRAYYGNLRDTGEIARVVAKFLSSMADDLKANPSLSVSTVSNQHYPNLQAGLVGTEGNPKGLSQIFIDAYGVDNPTARRLAIEQAQATLDTMLAEINATTAKRMQEALASGVTGQELDYLIDSAVLNANQDRPNLIARDQSVAVYNEGNSKRWESAGVQEAIFQTVRDTHVCQLCEPLHGKRFNIKQGIYVEGVGYVRNTHVHPECRCFARPAEDSINIEQLAGEIING